MAQRKLFPKTRAPVNEKFNTVAGTTNQLGKKEETFSFYKQKIELRSYHKKLRAGIVQWEDVPREYQELLQRFYGYDNLGVQR